MKKILLGMLVLGAITSSSCKKDKDPSCETSVAGIANTYKLTRVYAEAAGQTTDVPLDACELSGVYVLKSDKTATYVESGSGCNTTVQNGTWDVVNGNVTISVGYGVSDAQTFSWDCSTLVVGHSQSAGGVTITNKYDFRKQ